MQAWESESDREMVARLIAESQRPASVVPEGPWRLAEPADVREIRRSLDDAYGAEADAHVTASLVSVAVFAGMVLGIVLGFVMGRGT